jgi:uncharacterized protein YcaQ
MRKPAIDPIERENQMIALAMDRAEERLKDGSATSQEIVHFLKLGSSREKAEREKLERENEVLRAKAEAYQSAKNIEELYSNAIDSMRLYSGKSDEEY